MTLEEQGAVIEMILDDVFAPAGNEDELFDACFLRLFHRILNDRLVDDGKHFLRHGFGGRKEPRAHAGNGQNGFADRRRI